jgi:uncharacterized protein (TIGR02270 family)
MGEAASNILWEVVAEHLDEAEFLLEQWGSPTLRATLSLAQVRRSVEPRLEGHLEGLAAGGEDVAARLLWPALRGVVAGGDDPVEPGRGLAAALALAESGAPGSLDGLLAFAVEGEGGGAALVDPALEIGSRPDVDKALRAALARATPARAAGLLGVLAARRADPGTALPVLLDASDPDLLRAAVQAAAAVRPPEARALVAHLLGSPDRRLRATATEVAVEWRIEAGWRACTERVRRGDPRFLPLVTMFGGAADLAPVLDALADPRQREPALWALGFSGRLQAVEAAVPLLAGDDRTARLAGEVISAISGLAIDGELRRPAAPEPDELPDLDEDLRTGLRVDAVDVLPLPAPGPVAAWWEASRARFAPEQRYIRGKPCSPETVHEALLQGPLRRFELLALEVAVRTNGRVLIPRVRLGLELPPVSALASADFQASIVWS